MQDRFKWVMQKVAQAHRHKDALIKICQDFIQSEPYSLGFRVEPDQRCAYYVKTARDLPPEIPCFLGDVLHNLRCALDHLAYQLVLSNSHQTLLKPEQIYFPISATREKYERRKSKPDSVFSKISRDAAAALDDLKPYGGDNNGLWYLHALNNIDKHRMVLTAATSGTSVDLGLGHILDTLLGADSAVSEEVRNARLEASRAFASQSTFFRLADELFPLQVGDVFLYGPPGGTFNPTVKLKVSIAVGESSVISPTPIAMLLDTIWQSVSTALNRLQPCLT